MSSLSHVRFSALDQTFGLDSEQLETHPKKYRYLSEGNEAEAIGKLLAVDLFSRFDFLKVSNENGETALHIVADKKMMWLVYELLNIVPKRQIKPLLNLKDFAGNTVIMTIALNISDENQEHLINIFRMFLKDENSDFLENHSVGKILDAHPNQMLAKKITTISIINEFNIDENNVVVAEKTTKIFEVLSMWFKRVL